MLGCSGTGPRGRRRVMCLTGGAADAVTALKGRASLAQAPAAVPLRPVGPTAHSGRTNPDRAGHTDCMSSRRRLCPECRREIAVVAGRFARHDPPGARERGGLVSCSGSRRQAELGAAQPSLDGYAVPVVPGQLPLF
ncbi:hypothetical protein M2164_003627 [Streptomyces sp. SAI-208]|nr:hypothetical protein [Streptomyces sp. SAI-208]